MDDRIGALHLHYRIRGGTLASARTAGVERAVLAGFGEALSRRMTAMLGDDKTVIVVREIKASVALGPDQCALDSHVVDCFSRAAAQAVVALLADDPSSDAVMRFEDQAEFTGSFIVALIGGSAWERWYYGAFHRYRSDDPASTLRAVLTESGAEAAAVFGWLARRGHLAALLALLTPREARRLLGAGTRPASAADRTDGSAVLVDAAKRLLAALRGPQNDRSPSTATERIAQFLAMNPVAPDWSSTASLSVWVMQLLRFVLRQPDGAMPPIAPPEQAALRTLLAGPLDWLDARWLEAQLCGAMPAARAAQIPAPALRRQLLTPRQERILEQLACGLRDGELQLAAGLDEDDIVVRLIAWAAASAGSDGAPDRGIIAVIEQAARVYMAAQRDVADTRTSAADTATGGARERGTQPPPAAAINALRAAAPSAVTLLNAMLGAGPQDRQPGAPCAFAGIFLLARAVSDLRLPALARQAGVALAPLLAALAAAWSGAALAAGPVTTLWCGAEEADASGLDVQDAVLDALNDALLDLLIDRHVLDAATAREIIAGDAAALGHARQTARGTMTACILLRGWAHWLPGVAGSSALFLLQRSVRRGGSVRISERRIDVELAPAPLDIVLQMAGYLAPIGQVEWLGGRSVVFTLREPAP